MVEHEDERCGKDTKLYPEECCEPNGEGEYKDDDGQVCGETIAAHTKS